MKLREFWIEFTGNPNQDKTREIRYVSGEEPKFLAPEDESIHVREVNPELDAAYADCYEILKEFNKKYSPGDYWFPEIREAFAILKKARNE
jgi:hypothetical protein